MAKFAFNLEGVLKQRAAVERTRQLAVAVIEHERLLAEDEIRGHQRDFESRRSEVRQMLAPGAPVDFRDVRMQAGSTLHVLSNTSRSALKLAGVHNRLAISRGELLRATTARKAVEKLKERRFEEWRIDQKRREAAAVDELSVIRGNRSQEVSA
ncbi:MAG: flagellar FliJ family protein [Planctomycetota bacterium]